MLTAIADKIDVSTQIAALERTGLVAFTDAVAEPNHETTIEAPAAVAVRINLAIDANAQTLLDSLPVRAAKFMKPLIARGQDVKARRLIAAGRNPFDASTPRWLQFAGARLVLQGSYAKSDLRAMFVREFEWSDATASSRVSVVVALFPALRIATVWGERIVCAPSDTGDH